MSNLAMNSDQRDRQEAAVRNMIQKAREGSLVATQDLVHFVRVAPQWHFATVVNALADLLATVEATSAQRTAIESLRGTSIYVQIEREAAIIRVTNHARLCETKAVSDLVEIAKSPSYAHHPKVIEALVAILVSKTAPKEHRAAVESLRGSPIFSTIDAMGREHALVSLLSAAKSGDIEATRDLVTIAKSGRFMNERRIIEALADIFLSDATSKPTKALVWSLRDSTIYSEYVIDSDRHEVFVSYGDEPGQSGWVDEGPIGHYENYTLWRYLQECRGAELEYWLAKERSK